MKRPVKITATHDNGAVHDITTGVQVLYDHMANSMDWGSGFLDFDEVQAIRALGYQCGFEFIHYQGDLCSVCGHSHTQHGMRDIPCRVDWRHHTEYRIDGVPVTDMRAYYATSQNNRACVTIIDKPGCSCPGYISAALAAIEGGSR